MGPLLSRFEESVNPVPYVPQLGTHYLFEALRLRRVFNEGDQPVNVVIGAQPHLSLPAVDAPTPRLDLWREDGVS